MSFWLFDWFRENQIESVEQIQVILNDRHQFKALQRAAMAAPDTPVLPLSSPRGLVAGRGIDLTGIGACQRHRECISSQVDKLLRRVWFYFDEVIVDDMTSEITRMSSKKLEIEAMAGWLEAVLYLQKIGAEDLVRFNWKNIACKKCGLKHAHEMFHGEATDIEDELVRLFDRTTTLHLEPDHVSKAQVQVHLHGPYFGPTGYGSVRALTWVKARSEAEIKRLLINSAVSNGLWHLYNDTLVSKAAEAPLGSATKLESFLLEYASSPTGSIDDKIAFELSLPFIENVPVSELIRIRAEETEAFDAFRSRVRQAIHERLKTASDSRPSDIAREIEEDLIEPDLASLRHKLKRSAETMAKSVAGVGVGAFVGIVGLCVPALAPVGVAGGVLSAASINSVFALLRERSAVKSSDMYLLLEAERRHD